MVSASLFPIQSALRRKLKHPIGELILEKNISKESLTSKLQGHDSLIVSVGDKTTERLIDYQLTPKIQIVDGLEKRVRRNMPKFEGSADRIFHAKSPAGAISKEALAVLSKSLERLREDRDIPVRIEIEGEEDLLVLPIVAFFPEETRVAYGQPGEGMVLVVAKGLPRDFAQKALYEMGIRKLP